MNRYSQRDYFRADQDEVLSTPIEVARTLPDDVLRLAGYCKFPPPFAPSKIYSWTSVIYFFLVSEADYSPPLV